VSPGRGVENPLAGAANLRGGILIAVAVIVGVVLLGKGFDSGIIGSSGGDPSDEVAAGNDAGDGDTDVSDVGSTTTTTAAAHTPGEVRVQVLNGGATVAGSAGTASQTLSVAGYNVLAAENADTDVTATAVFAAVGYEADAVAVATALGLTIEPQAMPPTPPTPAPVDINVVVVLGPDFTPAG
jgi:hypothetical protein